MAKALPACAILLILCSAVQAASILGFALVGGQGHQLPMLRAGQELASRGHSFTMLISEHDEITRDLLTSKAFPGLNLLTFQGPADVGTRQWFSSIPRDSRQAGNPRWLLQNWHSLPAPYATAQYNRLNTFPADNYSVRKRQSGGGLVSAQS